MATSLPSPDSSKLDSSPTLPLQISGVALPAVRQPSFRPGTLPLSRESRPLQGPLPDPAVPFRISPTLLQVSGAPRPSGPICGPGSSHLPGGFPGCKKASDSSPRRHPIPQALFLNIKSLALPLGTPTHPRLRHLLGPAPAPLRRFLLPSHNSARAPLRLCGRRSDAQMIGAE